MTLVWLVRISHSAQCLVTHRCLAVRDEMTPRAKETLQRWSARLLEIVTEVFCRQKRQNMQSNKCMAENCQARFWFVWMLLLVNGEHGGRGGKSFSLFALQWCFISPSSLTLSVHNCPHLLISCCFGSCNSLVAPLPSHCTASTVPLCRAGAKALTVGHVQRSDKRGGK